METQNKILTVIVPSYNMEAYLPKCLGSLIIDDKELLQKLEVIVVNDGSKDRTSEIAHEFETKYPGVFRVIDKENGHYGSCINAGLAIATGFYVKVLDADDWFVTGHFQNFLRFIDNEYLKGSDSADLILSDWEQGTESDYGAVICSYSYLKTCEDYTVADIEFSDGHRFEMFAVTYKLEVIKCSGYRQDEGITHTDKLWINLPMAFVHKVKTFDEVIYHYYATRPENTCNRIEFYRTYYVQMEMIKRMIRQYNVVEEKLEPENKKFMQKHIKYRAVKAYVLNIIERNPLLIKCDLKDFDDYIKGFAPWLYYELDKLTISRRLPYKYIRDWRRHQAVTFLIKIKLISAMVVLRSYIVLCGVKRNIFGGRK